MKNTKITVWFWIFGWFCRLFVTRKLSLAVADFLLFFSLAELVLGHECNLLWLKFEVTKVLVSLYVSWRDKLLGWLFCPLCLALRFVPYLCIARAHLPCIFPILAGFVELPLHF